MDPEARGCGELYAVYAAARAGDAEETQARWAEAEPVVRALDSALADRLDTAQADGDTEAVRSLTAELLFDADPSPTLDGLLATVVGTLLYAFGYVAAFVLFFRARSREAVVRRLRRAYRTVGVAIQDTESVDGVERTVFRCPYRTVGAERWGERRACHDVLDRVDDGYVTYLRRHRDLDYVRPRACAASECCYSTVADRR